MFSKEANLGKSLILLNNNRTYAGPMLDQYLSLSGYYVRMKRKCLNTKHIVSEVDFPYHLYTCTTEMYWQIKSVLNFRGN